MAALKELAALAAGVAEAQRLAMELMDSAAAVAARAKLLVLVAQAAPE
jgi:hypothetical protein